VRSASGAVIISGLMNAHTISLDGVSVVRWGRSILTDISVQVTAGSCCAILGPNGSGKSTLLAILSKLFDCRVEILRSNGRYIAGVSDGSL